MLGWFMRPSAPGARVERPFPGLTSCEINPSLLPLNLYLQHHFTPYPIQNTIHQPKMPTPEDAHTFLLPEDYFASFNNAEFTSASQISYEASDNLSTNPVITTGILLRVHPNDNTPPPLLLLQFARPKVWRIRFSPSVTDAGGYDDYNS